MNVEESTQAIAQLVWYKSSYSSGAGGECIEIAVKWRKSSHSGAEGGECVEVATCPDTVHVRDSKDKAGPTLSFAADEWAPFVEFAAQS